MLPNAAGAYGHLATAQGTKVMVLPQHYPPAGLAPNPYAGVAPAAQPTLYTDATGRTYVVTGAHQPQVQYHIAPPGGMKVSVQQCIIFVRKKTSPIFVWFSQCISTCRKQQTCRQQISAGFCHRAAH